MKSYKDKHSVHNSPEDWIIFENTQEAIVVQRCSITEPVDTKSKDKDGNPTGKYTNAQDNYTCSTYSKAKSKFENKCTQHHVRTDVVRDLLLKDYEAELRELELSADTLENAKLDVPMPELTPEQIK